MVRTPVMIFALTVPDQTFCVNVETLVSVMVIICFETEEAVPVIADWVEVTDGESLADSEDPTMLVYVTKTVGGHSSCAAAFSTKVPIAAKVVRRMMSNGLSVVSLLHT